LAEDLQFQRNNDEYLNEIFIGYYKKPYNQVKPETSGPAENLRKRAAKSTDKSQDTGLLIMLCYVMQV
jgi:hypothetical protein